ncbi:MAG: hypothetical protein L0H26_11610 [Microlunatus sp.]|nr:hypothetical protein [Microlunatus sp.]
MMVTIDKAGQVVIPKDARDQLSIGLDTELELTILGDAIQLSPVRPAGRAVSLIDGFPRITYSVLTRMPGALRLDAPSAIQLLDTAFPDRCRLDGDSVDGLLRQCGTLGITGGAVYDAPRGPGGDRCRSNAADPRPAGATTLRSARRDLRTAGVVSD